MAGLSISRAWDDTKAVLRRDGRLYAIVALALFVVPGLLSDLVTPAVPPGELPPPGIWLLFALITAVGLLVGVLAISRLALGHRLRVGEALAGAARRVLPLIAASLLWVLPFALLFSLLLTPYQADPQSAPFAVSVLLLALLVAYLVVGIRMILITPVAANEAIGPIGIIKRSWQLTHGRWWKLFGFLLVALVALMILLLAITAVAGTVVGLVGGGAGEPMSMSRLLVSLASQLVSALGLTLVMIMLTRIYAQLAGAEQATNVTVPHAP